MDSNVEKIKDLLLMDKTPFRTIVGALRITKPTVLTIQEEVSDIEARARGLTIYNLLRSLAGRYEPGLVIMTDHCLDENQIKLLSKLNPMIEFLEECDMDCAMQTITKASVQIKFIAVTDIGSLASATDSEQIVGKARQTAKAVRIVQNLSEQNGCTIIVGSLMLNSLGRPQPTTPSSLAHSSSVILRVKILASDLHVRVVKNQFSSVVNKTFGFALDAL
jgi:hypothetical protein